MGFEGYGFGAGQFDSLFAQIDCQHRFRLFRETLAEKLNRLRRQWRKQNSPANGFGDQAGAEKRGRDDSNACIGKGLKKGLKKSLKKSLEMKFARIAQSETEFRKQDRGSLFAIAGGAREQMAPGLCKYRLGIRGMG